MPPPRQQKKIIVELPDGKRIWASIPSDGTREEIESAVKDQVLAQQQVQPQQETQLQPAVQPSSSIQPQVQPQMQDQGGYRSVFQSNPTLGQEQSTPPQIQPQAADPGFLQKAMGFLTKPFNASPQNSPNISRYFAAAGPTLPTTFKSKEEAVAEAQSMIEMGVGAGATIGATALTGNPAVGALAGSVAMPVTNEIIRHYLNQGPSKSITGYQYQSPVGPIIEGTLLNELGGKVIGAGIKGFKAIGASPAELAASTGVSEEALKLGGTTGQLLGNKSLGGKIVSAAEDVFARGTKQASIEKSSQQAVADLKSSMAGMTPLNAPPEIINALLKDENRLGSFLRSGNVAVKGQLITSNNARRDLQGWVMDQIFYKNAKFEDPSNLAKVSLSG